MIPVLFVTTTLSIASIIVVIKMRFLASDVKNLDVMFVGNVLQNERNNVMIVEVYLEDSIYLDKGTISFVLIAVEKVLVKRGIGILV